MDWSLAITAGDRRAIARALTAVENNTPQCAAILAAIKPALGKARVIGITGPPGVGKSTLVGACIGELRDRGLSVGVVAVDPTSPVSGGALLGDRVRMQDSGNDSQVFIRSLASRGHLGGLSLAARCVVDVLDAAGMDVILVETVGIGQSEVEIAQIAQIQMVVLQPGTGDQIQALKAGVLEIADLLVVNKSDLPGADRSLLDLRQMLELRRLPDRDIPICKTTATSGEGIPELVEKLLTGEIQSAANKKVRDLSQIRSLLAQATGTEVSRSLLVNQSPEISSLCVQVQTAEISLQQAVEMLAAKITTVAVE